MTLPQMTLVANLDYQQLCEVRDCAYAFQAQNWLQSIRLRSVPMRQLSKQQIATADRHEDIAEMWRCVKVGAEKRIREIVEQFR